MKSSEVFILNFQALQKQICYREHLTSEETRRRVELGIQDHQEMLKSIKSELE